MGRQVSSFGSTQGAQALARVNMEMTDKDRAPNNFVSEREQL
jgi:hypothetical protein